MRELRTLTVLLCCQMLAAATARAGDCVADGEIATITGEISRATLPGPPNYRSIQDGDRAETFWILAVRTPQCFRPFNFELGLLNEGLEVGHFQLVLDQDEYRQYDHFVGQEVQVVGVLFTGSNANHRAPALIDVLKIAGP